MKSLLFIFSILALNVQAEIFAKFGTGNAQQVFIGNQPNDRPTSHIDLKVSIETTSDYNGIQAAIGYEFLCAGDTFPNKEQIINSTSTKTLNLKFKEVTPLNYQNWTVSSSGEISRNCNMTWSVSAVGTRANNGTNIGAYLEGMFGGITLNFTSSNISPEFKKARAANSVFPVMKELLCF